MSKCDAARKRDALEVVTKTFKRRSVVAGGAVKDAACEAVVLHDKALRERIIEVLFKLKEKGLVIEDEYFDRLAHVVETLYIDENGKSEFEAPPEVNRDPG